MLVNLSQNWSGTSKQSVHITDEWSGLKEQYGGRWLINV